MNKGDVLHGTFRVERLLGEGTAGEVYEVRLAVPWRGFGVGERFALKLYKQDIFSREEPAIAVRRRIREAVAGGAVASRHVVRTFDTQEFWERGAPPFLLMEYLEGESLDAFVRRRRPLGDDVVADLLRQLADGLAALHEVGLIHRDLKPQNVFVTNTGRVVILDLGVVRPHGEPTITASQTFLGTLRYASPEWLFGEECTASSDAYSLGTILYLLLTGTDVFAPTTLYSKLVLAVQGEVPIVPHERARPLGAFLEVLASRLLEKSPSNRPPIEDVREFLRASGASRLWRELRGQELEGFLPPLDKIEDRDRVAAIATSALSERVIDEIIAERDYERLLREPDVLTTLSEIVGDVAKEYVRLPRDERVAWLDQLIREIWSSSSGDGEKIESEWWLTDRIAQIETCEELRPLVEQRRREGDEKMSGMIRGLAQENPAF